MPSPAPDLTKISDTELVEHLLEAKADEDSAKLGRKKLENELLRRKDAELKAAYTAKPEPYGVVNLAIGDRNVKIDTRKDVKWDQDKLQALWNQMLADGADPRQYIKCEYDVSETSFKSWGDNLKAYFNPARTVKSGNPSIKIEEAKE